ncbi:MAG: hypothetical protein CL840_18380 [Crocinitomicaceae bacterium]|nr:hypothetical protein [Crocinitomicaceae bacterium]|tara:strand:+ start:4535 stop:5656 length:1122 start_codon:yes stop_codon:yes gene_type:complete
MRYCIGLVLGLLVQLNGFGQNCSSLFSYGAQFEKVAFINHSTGSNLHYWWNFGDGTGSNFKNPIHTFPETGTYLTTLFLLDTITGCSDHYEIWIDLTKYSTDTCDSKITDSLYTYNGESYIKVVDLSKNCDSHVRFIDAGSAANFRSGMPILINDYWNHGRFLSRMRYMHFDTSTSIYTKKREAYKSTPYKYSSNSNYTDCSANFEFVVAAESSHGQLIKCKAMNNSAKSYQWSITGFGVPILYYTDTMSHFYPFNSVDIRSITLTTIGFNGCKDTVHQHVLVRPGLNTIASVDDYEPDENIHIYPNPTSSRLHIDLEGEASYQLLDISGRELLSGKITPEVNALAVDGLSNGTYVLWLRQEGKIATVKFIKK